MQSISIIDESYGKNFFCGEQSKIIPQQPQSQSAISKRPGYTFFSNEQSKTPSSYTTNSNRNIESSISEYKFFQGDKSKIIVNKDNQQQQQEQLSSQNLNDSTTADTLKISVKSPIRPKTIDISDINGSSFFCGEKSRIQTNSSNMNKNYDNIQTDDNNKKFSSNRYNKQARNIEIADPTINKFFCGEKSKLPRNEHIKVNKDKSIRDEQIKKEKVDTTIVVENDKVFNETNDIVIKQSPSVSEINSTDQKYIPPHMQARPIGNRWPITRTPTITTTPIITPVPTLTTTPTTTINDTNIIQLNSKSNTQQASIPRSGIRSGSNESNNNTTNIPSTSNQILPKGKYIPPHARVNINTEKISQEQLSTPLSIQETLSSAETPIKISKEINITRTIPQIVSPAPAPAPTQTQTPTSTSISIPITKVSTTAYVPLFRRTTAAQNILPESVETRSISTSIETNSTTSNIYLPPHKRQQNIDKMIDSSSSVNKYEKTEGQFPDTQQQNEMSTIDKDIIIPIENLQIDDKVKNITTATNNNTSQWSKIAASTQPTDTGYDFDTPTIYQQTMNVPSSQIEEKEIRDVDQNNDSDEENMLPNIPLNKRNAQYNAQFGDNSPEPVSLGTFRSSIYDYLPQQPSTRRSQIQVFSISQQKGFQNLDEMPVLLDIFVTSMKRYIKRTCNLNGKKLERDIYEDVQYMLLESLNILYIQDIESISKQLDSCDAIDEWIDLFKDIPDGETSLQRIGIHIGTEKV